MNPWRQGLRSDVPRQPTKVGRPIACAAPSFGTDDDLIYV